LDAALPSRGLRAVLHCLGFGEASSPLRGKLVLRDAADGAHAPVLETPEAKVANLYDILHWLCSKVDREDLLGGFDKEPVERVRRFVDLFAKELATGIVPGQVVTALESDLRGQSVLCQQTLTVADVLVCLALHGTAASLNAQGHPNVLRWFDFVQHHSSVLSVAAPVAVTVPHRPSQVFETNIDSLSRASAGAAVPAAAPSAISKPPQQPPSGAGAGAEVAGKGANKTKNSDKDKDKTKPPPAAAAEAKDEGGAHTIHRMDLRVGRILSAKQHPNADRLFVLEVDVGEAKPRIVCSGLVDCVSVDKLTGLCVVAVNLPEADLKGVASNGRMLAATSADGKSKELVTPPQGAKVGERVSFKGADGAPDQSLASKHQHKIFKELHTNASCVAQYKDIDFMTSAGPCKAATIANGTVA
jgi:methionine--tRNA ligase beta chain